MALPHSAEGWPAVCDCGISLSHSLTFCWSVKRKSGTAHVNKDSQWRKQSLDLHVRLGCGSLVNHNTSVTSGE